MSCDSSLEHGTLLPSSVGVPFSEGDVAIGKATNAVSCGVCHCQQRQGSLGSKLLEVKSPQETEGCGLCDGCSPHLPRILLHLSSVMAF